MARPRKQKAITVPDSVLSLEPAGKDMYGKDIYRDNPFITANNFCLNLGVRGQIVGEGLEIKDKEGDDVSAGKVATYKEVDETAFIKLFTGEIANIFEMNQTSLRVLLAVFAAVQDQAKNKAEIYFTYQKALEYYEKLNINKPPSRPIFSKGIKQLIELKFIAAHYLPGWFWINPNLLFNGDRVIFAKGYIKKRNDEKHITTPVPLKQGNLIENNPLE